MPHPSHCQQHLLWAFEGKMHFSGAAKRSPVPRESEGSLASEEDLGGPLLLLTHTHTHTLQTDRRQWEGYSGHGLGSHQDEQAP